MQEIITLQKKTDKRIIEEITNSFFIEKEEAFLSNEDLDITKYYNTNDVKKIKNDSSFNLFEYEKQMRNENNSNISDEKLDYTINSVTVIGDIATAICYEYYEYTYKNDTERSSRGTEYQITFEKKDNEWEIVNLSFQM